MLKSSYQHPCHVLENSNNWGAALFVSQVNIAHFPIALLSKKQTFIGHMIGLFV